MNQSLDSLESGYLEALLDFVRIPSVSTDPGQRPAMQAACAWLERWAQEQGFLCEVWETPGQPCVYIETPPVEGQPTLLVYGHYDVQPAESPELWRRPPFEPYVEDDRLYGRGASDNKGQIWMHCCALDWLRRSQGLPVQVKLLIEGEEEIGSPSLPAVLRTHRQRLQADFVLVSDTSTVVKGRPTLHYSLRGIVLFEVELEVAGRDVHSGVFGGTSPNAIHEMSRLIASLHDSEGRVIIPDFYAGVREIEAWEQAMLEAIPFDEEAYRSFIGCRQLVGERGFTTNQRRWFRPTLDCNGISGGFQGQGSKTIIPAQARAKFSCRLVPDQQPEQVMQACQNWFEALPGVRFFPQGGGPPYFFDPRGPLAGVLARASQALEEAFQQSPLLVRHGGAIPIVSQFESELGLSTLLMGFGSPDDAIHSPNEKFELENFRRGLRALVQFLSSCGEAPSGSPTV